MFAVCDFVALVFWVCVMVFGVSARQDFGGIWCFEWFLFSDGLLLFCWFVVLILFLPVQFWNLAFLVFSGFVILVVFVF